jgi:O-antigen ligase
MQLGVVLALIFVASSRWSRFTVALIALSVVVETIASCSRAASVGLIVVLGIFFFCARIRHKRLLFLVAITVVCLAFVSAVILFPDIGVMERANWLTGSSSYGLTFRIALLEMSIEMARENPFLGVGAGCFTEEYSRFTGKFPVLRKEYPNYNHNTFGCALAESGLIGLMAYILIHLAVLGHILYALRFARDTETQIIAVGLLSSYTGFLVSLNFYHVTGSKLGWSVMALAVALARLVRLQQEKASEAEKLHQEGGQAVGGAKSA